jgi:hypothetical protein
MRERIGACVLHTVIRVRSKKEGPDALAGRGQSLRLLAVWGTITGLFDADACASDLGSNLRDVTASTKRLSSHSKGAGQHQRLCLVPHTCRFLGQQSLGVEPAVKSMPLHLRPALPFREKRTTSPTRENYRLHDGFFAASCSRIALWL